MPISGGHRGLHDVFVEDAKSEADYGRHPARRPKARARLAVEALEFLEAAPLPYDLVLER